MKIVLIYPPPWKIQGPGGQPIGAQEGPPAQLDELRCLQGDILNVPYGLLSLARQARRAGHLATVLNLFTYPWHEIERIMSSSGADLYGLSCFTSNRRGTHYLATLIREIHPSAHIAVGGPHATALATELLARAAAIDTVIIGEGERAFAELVRRLERKQATAGIPGTAWRRGSSVERGKPGRCVENLDELASPFDDFNEYILISSRGCPWNCTFCSSAMMWGRRPRFHSARYVLDMLDQIVNGNRQKAVAIKDETFTHNRRHVLDICRGIRQRQLNFLWSCDTRADALDEELLHAMRQAGCQRISIGVESGAPEILKNLNKQIDLDTVRAATALARRLGFQIRFYLLVGSPGETLATLQASLDFIRAAKPSEVIFNPFTLLPGTSEYERAIAAGTISSDIFFEGCFLELQPVMLEGDDPQRQAIAAWLRQNAGLQRIAEYSVAERRQNLEVLPGLHAAHLDLAGAHYQAGSMPEASAGVRRALDLNYPLPGLCYNYLACIAARQGDVRAALDWLLQARSAGFHRIVEDNIACAQAWAQAGGTASGLPLQLAADHAFEVTRRRQQPMTPGSMDLRP